MGIKYHSHIIGDNAEAIAGAKLLESLKKTAPKNVDGEIIVSSNQQFYGYQTKDVDILIYGIFENFCIQITQPIDLGTEPLFDVDAVLSAKLKDNPDFHVKWPAKFYINEICATVEVKSHDARSVCVKNTHLLVRYRGGWHSATEQVSKQKFTVLEFFRRKYDHKPRVAGLVWLSEFDKIEKQSLLSGTTLENVVLAATPTFSDLLRAVFQDCPPYYNADKGYFAHGYGKWGDIQQVVDGLKASFDTRDLPKGMITKKKMETLSRKLLDTQEYVKAIDQNKLVVLRGRAGTGKTLKLLRIAVELAEDRSHRCLILTYNHALVSDIRRLLAFHGSPDRDEKAVNIMTLHSFFYNLFVSLRLIEKGDNLFDEDSKYLKNIHDLKDICTLAKTRGEIIELMHSNFELVDYDNVFIDEAQDWFEEERDLIRLLFQGRSIIVSDGQDQLVRRGTHCDWTSGLSRDQFHRKAAERRSVRQKRNIVKFLNEFARHAELEWSLEGSDDLSGGRIVVIYGALTARMYQRVLNDLKSAQCIGYDLLLATPGSVHAPLDKLLPKVYFDEHAPDTELEYLDLRSHKKDKLANQYVTDAMTARVSFYESLRGVEAWTLIAHSFDVFLRAVEARRQEDTLDGKLRLETDEEKAHRLAALWGLIAMTRPVDTLVLHLTDPDSKWSKIISEASEQLQDLVEVWSDGDL